VIEAAPEDGLVPKNIRICPIVASEMITADVARHLGPLLERASSVDRF